MQYPDAERGDLVEQLPLSAPSEAVADPYRWLEDPSDARTVAWSSAQDDLVESIRPQWSMRHRFAERVHALLGAGAIGPPVWRGQRRFFIRRASGQEHGVLLVAEPGPDGAEAERVLIDPMAIDPSGATTLDSWQPSKEGDLLAYQVSEGGSEESVLRVIEVATGEMVDGPIDRARYSPVAWLVGGESFYYVRRLPPQDVPEGEQQFHRRVWWHRLGTDPAEDAEVFGAGRAITSYFGVSVSWDGRWLVLSAAEGTDPRNDVWLADLHADAAATPALREVAVGLDARTSAHVGRDGRLYVHTDLHAPRGRLAVADPAAPEPDRWRDLVPQAPDAVLEDYLLLDGPALGEGGVLLASWTSHAVSAITTHDAGSGRATGRVELPGLGTVGGLIGRPEGGHEAWFAYTDHTTVARIERYDARTGEVGTCMTPPGVVEIPDVVTQHLECTSVDGTTVRMFLTAPAATLDERGAPRGPSPLVLSGYGGFGVSMTPAYSAGSLAWVEAGGVAVVANLRGGGEEGEEWHRAGMLATKQNVFDDFEACARALIERGWTTPDQLAISGGSNGGLLVGAATTQWPELVTAVVCSAPLLDMVRYQLHGLGESWTGEYGDAEDPDQLRVLLSYSPYHRVIPDIAYPAVLFTVFDSDSRVDPLHARKMAAALQYATTSPIGERPVLVRRESDVGHGARALSRSVDLAADTLAFMAHLTGLRAPS